MGSIARRDRPGMPAAMRVCPDAASDPMPLHPWGQAIFSPEFIGTENGSGIGMLFQDGALGTTILQILVFRARVILQVSDH